MGLALDEPVDSDLRQQTDGVEFVIAERDAAMVLHGGPVFVRYEDRSWSRGYRVTAGRRTGTC